MSAGVYLIRQIDKARAYVGSSIDVKRRFAEHKLLLTHNEHHCSFLQHAWNKYGAAAFEFTLQEETDPIKEELLAAEQKWLDNYNGELFNQARKAYSRLGVKASAETLTKLSVAGKRVSSTIDGKDHLLRMSAKAHGDPHIVELMAQTLRSESQTVEGRKRRKELCTQMWQDGRMKATSEEMSRRSRMRKLYSTQAHKL